MDNLKTGDLIMFCSNNNSGFMGLFSSLIKYGSHSNYTHIGMILKDPTFINKNLKGLYVWESGYEGQPDPQDNFTKLGVQITPLYEMINNYKNSKIIIRKLKTEEEKLNDHVLHNIHSVVHNKPYDINILDWIQALIGIDISPQKIDRFWCSAFVGYIYTSAGILKEDIDWSILSPSDFSLEAENLKFTEGCSLEKTITQIN